MVTNRIAFVIIAIIIAAGFAASLLKINLVQALADATTSTTTNQSTSVPASTTTAQASSTADTATATTSSQTTAAPAAPAPVQSTLTAVHIVGTKYIDYCTDGTKVTAYPGDPAIDAHFDVPNAPTPKCPAGQTWDHTNGMDKYDTATGDLDVGDYARQADGTYSVHYPAATYTDATSTSNWPDRTVTVSVDPSTIPVPGTPVVQ
jgi:cytoskeletal protein RodZ